MAWAKSAASWALRHKYSAHSQAQGETWRAKLGGRSKQRPYSAPFMQQIRAEPKFTAAGRRCPVSTCVEKDNGQQIHSCPGESRDWALRPTAQEFTPTLQRLCSKAANRDLAWKAPSKVGVPTLSLPATTFPAVNGCTNNAKIDPAAISSCQVD